jgi:hypothetical protein
MPSPSLQLTNLILVTTLVVTAVGMTTYVATRARPAEAEHAAPYLVLFTALFLARVVGQVYVRRRQPSWLPPTEQWNLSPYVLLLPTQIAILALMGWIDADFVRGAGTWMSRRPALGNATLIFSMAYAFAMALRYVVRMVRQPDQRWFGGAIPIVFHFVLAAYLFVFGTVHAGR